MSEFRAVDLASVARNLLCTWSIGVTTWNCFLTAVTDVNITVPPPNFIKTAIASCLPLQSRNLLRLGENPYLRFVYFGNSHYSGIAPSDLRSLKALMTLVHVM